MEAFVLHLRRTGKKATTISQYISHLNEYLLVRYVKVELRGDQIATVLQCARRQDDLLRPARLSQKIPISAALMVLIFRDIDRHFVLDPRHISACCCVAYGLCCRIHEVLFDGRTVDIDGLPIQDHAVKTPHLSFKFPGDPRLYKASAPADFPPGRRPSSFACFHDSLKNDTGGSGTRCVAANPSGRPFDLVGRVFDYVVACRPPPGGHLFPHLRADSVSKVIKRVFASVGLDGSRGCPHAMRTGSLSMVQALRHSSLGVTAEQEQEHGMWRSAQGLKPYRRTAFASGSETSSALYDVSYMPVDYLVWFYMSPAIAVADDGPEAAQGVV